MEAAPAQRQHQHHRHHSQHHHHQQPPGRVCPRCDSTHTKFCYYNNYSLSQPRYFCRGCRRYWTHGGNLRNVPVGGGSRKRSRRSPTPPPAFNHSSTPPPSLAPPSTAPCYFPFHGEVIGEGFFSSLVALQSVKLPALGIGAFPGSLPSSNLGNFFNGFEFGEFDQRDTAIGGWQNGLIGGDVGGIEQKLSGSTALMSPGTGDGAWSTVDGGEDSALKADQWTVFLGGEGDDNDK